MANCGRETKFTNFLRRFQTWLVVLRPSIVYLAGSYFFWLFTFPFIYKDVAGSGMLERLGYQIIFFLSPITAPLTLVAATFMPVLAIFGYASMRESILGLFLCWAIAVLSYSFTYFLVWIHIRALGALIKKSANSNV